VSQKITVPAFAISSGAMPALGICSRHGAPCTTVRVRKFISATPVWVLLLALLTLLIAAIVSLALRKTVTGPMPECTQCGKDRKAFVRNVWLGWGSLVPLLVIASATNSTGLLVLWFLVAVGALIFSFAGDSFRTRGTTSGDGAWVELKNVDSRFVQACHERMAQASAHAGAMASASPGYGYGYGYPQPTAAYGYPATQGYPQPPAAPAPQPSTLSGYYPPA
jgi:hypothetical protein